MDGKQEQIQASQSDFSAQDAKQSFSAEIPDTEVPRHKREKRPSPKRLQIGLDILTRAVAGKVETSGMEHLDELTGEDKIIFAVLHKHDVAMPIAASALAKEFPLAIAHQSTHNDIKVMINKVDPTGLGVRLLGSKSFVDITHAYDPKGNAVVPKFELSDYQNMRRVVEQEGKALVIAAHNPSTTGEVKGAAGLAVVAAASQIDNAKIVPVYVDFDDPDLRLGLAPNIVNTVKKRATARVVIGEPMTFDRVDLEVFTQVKNRHSLPDGQTVDMLAVRVAHQKLKDQANQVMKAIDNLKPPQKAA